MKKHIFGFALFSFIVGVAVVISNLLFFEPPKPAVYEVPNYSGGHYCRKYKQQNWNDGAASVKIEQAVFDSKTKQLRTFLSSKPSNGKSENLTVALHFFVKDGKMTRYLASEKILVNTLYDSEKESLLTSLSWLENLDSRDNLYIVPEIAEGWKNYKEYQPTFNYSTAAPVVVRR